MFCFNIYALAAQSSLPILEKVQKHLRSLVGNYYFPILRLTEEPVLPSRYSISFSIADFQANYIPYFYEFKPLRLGPSISRTLSRLIPIAFVFHLSGRSFTQTAFSSQLLRRGINARENVTPIAKISNLEPNVMYPPYTHNILVLLPP